MDLIIELQVQSCPPPAYAQHTQNCLPGDSFHSLGTQIGLWFFGNLWSCVYRSTFSALLRSNVTILLTLETAQNSVHWADLFDISYLVVAQY